MSGHVHTWFKCYRAGRRWRNQYGYGRVIIPDGAVCPCGKRIAVPF